LGVCVGVPIGVRALRTMLMEEFNRMPSSPVTSARSIQTSSQHVIASIVRNAKASPALHQKIGKAALTWDSLENLAGNVSVSFDDFVKNPGVTRQAIGSDAWLTRMAARSSTEQDFNRLLGEIASEVARLEGRPADGAVYLAALQHEFFAIAEQLGL